MASGEQGPSPGSITAIQVLASYAPAELVLRHAADRHPAPPSAPEREDFEGAVGFVDVSGFTALSERLQKDFGNKGSEKLNQYINSYLTRLIDGVSHHGGDVIKFAGDALQARDPPPVDE
ncbi:hypothetical protein EMIHUDRAFT_124345, partial [Emiliania huxleyi CCMP1516]